MAARLRQASCGWRRRNRRQVRPPRHDQLQPRSPPQMMARPRLPIHTRLNSARDSWTLIADCPSGRSARSSCLAWRATRPPGNRLQATARPTRAHVTRREERDLGGYHAGVSATVVLLVTPKQAIESDRYAGEVPADIAAALMAAGQPVNPGRSRIGSQPWRLHFQLSGADRVDTGQRLARQLAKLGYEVDVSFSP